MNIIKYKTSNIYTTLAPSLTMLISHYKYGTYIIFTQCMSVLNDNITHTLLYPNSLSPPIFYHINSMLALKILTNCIILETQYSLSNYFTYMYQRSKSKSFIPS